MEKEERGSNALQVSEYMASLGAQKRLLKLKAQQDLVFAAHGGIFKITPDLISFVHVLTSRRGEEAILFDSNDNPIRIPDMDAFLENLISQYFEVSHDCHAELDKLKHARTVESILEI